MACAQVCRKLPLPSASPVGYTHPRLMTPCGGAAPSVLEKHGSGLLLELEVRRTEVKWGPLNPQQAKLRRVLPGQNDRMEDGREVERIHI